MQKTETQLQQLVGGTQKDIPVTSVVDVNGANLKQADVIAKLQGWIGLYQQVDGAKASYETAQQVLKATEPDVHEFIVAYGQALKQVLGKSSPLLADFGLAATQRKAPSSQTQVLAAARRAATRAARGTLGSVQKQAVKGAPVTQVTVSQSSPSGLAVPEATVGAVPEPTASSVTTK